MSDELERLRAIVEGAFEGRGDESWQLEDLGPKLLAVVEAARLSDNSCTAGTEDYASCEEALSHGAVACDGCRNQFALDALMAAIRELPDPEPTEQPDPEGETP